MEWAIVEFAEEAMLPGVLGGEMIGEAEVKVMEGFAWNEVEASVSETHCSCPPIFTAFIAIGCSL